jgi:GTPase
MTTKIKEFSRVVVFGRTNVGKSALFNRMSSNSESIVFDFNGVTRDYIEDTVEWDKKKFTLVDTGGMGAGKVTDKIDTAVRELISNQLKKADVVLFVCDITTGILQLDHELAKLLRRSGKPALLLLNKADTKNHELALHEFRALGFKNIYPVSAIHGRGIGDVLDEIAFHIPDEERVEAEKPNFKVSIIGKPNVGKSSLLNLLLNEERALVSDVAGTTREAISKTKEIDHQIVELTDTAGVRRKRSVTDDLETLTVKASMQAVRSSDIVLLVVDASSGDLCSQELKLLSYAIKQDKAIAIILNKLDLVDVEVRGKMEDVLDQYGFLTDKYTTIWTSCISKKNVHKIGTAISKIWKRCTTKLSTIEVSDVVREFMSHRPLYRQRQMLKVFKVRPMECNVPTFHLYVNQPALFTPSYLNCIENVLRGAYDLEGCPIRFTLIKA